MNKEQKPIYSSAYIPQELLKELTKSGQQLTIGIPRERVPGEKRLALTPGTVRILTNLGFRVIVESGAGYGINYNNTYYSENGAEVVETSQEVFMADIVMKILPPTLTEVSMMRPRTSIFSMIQFNRFTREAYAMMLAKRITAIAYEWLPDESEEIPILNTISEIEGMTSVMIASDMLSNRQGGKGILLGGIPGVPPTEVVIIGAGKAGIAAAQTALNNGALVKVFDDDIHMLRQLQSVIGQKVYTSNFHPQVLSNAFKTADVVIGAIRFAGLYKHYVISEELIQSMKQGAIIIDLRVNQGGCFETTCGRAVTDKEIFEKYGVLHYCKPNISNDVARTTSMAFSNVMVPILQLIHEQRSIQGMILSDHLFRQGVYMYYGKTVNEYVASHFNFPLHNIDIYIAAH